MEKELEYGCGNSYHGSSTDAYQSCNPYELLLFINTPSHNNDIHIIMIFIVALKRTDTDWTIRFVQGVEGG